MKKSLKKFMVFTMACMLALTPVTALADITDPATAKGDTTGAGELEGVVDKDVFCVKLPTIAEDSDIFDFVLDPQMLIAATEGAAYAEDATFEDGASLFFATAVSGNSISVNDVADYAGTSSALLIENKSTFDVQVSVEAKLKDLEDSAKTYSIVPKASDDYTDDANTSMYLALNLGGATTAITAEGVNASAVISAVPADSYEVKYDEDSSEYTYELKDDVTTFPASYISLTGSCNTNETVDWMAAKNAAPSVDLKWSVNKPITVTVSGCVVTIEGLTGDRNYVSMTTAGTLNNTTPDKPATKNISYNATNWTEAEGGTLICTLSPNYATWYAGDTMVVTITLTDGSQVSGSVTFPAN